VWGACRWCQASPSPSKVATNALEASWMRSSLVGCWSVRTRAQNCQRWRACWLDVSRSSRLPRSTIHLLFFTPSVCMHLNALSQHLPPLPHAHHFDRSVALRPKHPTRSHDSQKHEDISLRFIESLVFSTATRCELACIVNHLHERAT
jgi:hypothetical protein